ncbi:MAG TPA: signal peptide peptidase SppA, partial [Victivallales bacterium]|nr:signal peptide peptidase SppA [Victivallales bacterium]
MCEEKKKGCGSGCFITVLITSLILGLLIFASFIFLIFEILSTSGFESSISSFNNTNGLIEKYVEGSKSSSNKIAMIEIRGMIVDNNGTALWELADSSLIVRQLMQANNDPTVKAVILYLDTPGGEVTAADNIYKEVLNLRKSGKIVVVYMNSVAASGGYYIAVASDYILAHRLCVTGSIGVIMQSYNYNGLLNKIGVFTETYKSGKMKDMLDGSRLRTPEEIALANKIVSQIYDEFVRIVSEGRKIPEDKIKNSEIGDGRIFLGNEALELGLIDQIGYYEDALYKTLELSKIPVEDYRVIKYQKTLSFSEIFANLKSSESKIS